MLRKKLSSTLNFNPLEIWTNAIKFDALFFRREQVLLKKYILHKNSMN